MSIFNSERETIWVLHNALLVANSLIVGALALTPSAFGTDRWACRAPHQFSAVSDHASRREASS
jgi:hypothetical protein